jgi:uncharacterized protein YPO0396
MGDIVVTQREQMATLAANVETIGRVEQGLGRFGADQEKKEAVRQDQQQETLTAYQRELEQQRAVAQQRVATHEENAAKQQEHINAYIALLQQQHEYLQLMQGYHAQAEQDRQLAAQRLEAHNELMAQQQLQLEEFCEFLEYKFPRGAHVSGESGDGTDGLPQHSLQHPSSSIPSSPTPGRRRQKSK